MLDPSEYFKSPLKFQTDNIPKYLVCIVKIRKQVNHYVYRIK